ncbi:hypothetical protein NDU88_000996 [Pleurodeles waltl]|uniref:Uncharacterized protein n=1 Tax=Pleurodeles waltl TaxID=8319 RepID=A0AAV7V6K3_PLEWA|nr:hypothetical protein NDU88_000996 [Pleurodeles waltl]
MSCPRYRLVERASLLHIPSLDTANTGLHTEVAQTNREQQKQTLEKANRNIASPGPALLEARRRATQAIQSPERADVEAGRHRALNPAHSDLNIPFVKIVLTILRKLGRKGSQEK